MSETREIEQIALRLAKRHEAQIGDCTLCGHRQEMPAGGIPMPSSLASSMWCCVRCGGQISVTVTIGGDEPAPDEDIQTLLAERDALASQVATLTAEVARLTLERDEAESRERVLPCTKLLFSGLTTVLVPEDGQWIMQSKEIDQCAQGSTPEQARSAFSLSLIATVLMLVNPRVAWHDPCPDDAWSELIARAGAEIERYAFVSLPPIRAARRAEGRAAPPDWIEELAHLTNESLDAGDPALMGSFRDAAIAYLAAHPAGEGRAVRIALAAIVTPSSPEAKEDWVYLAAQEISDEVGSCYKSLIRETIQKHRPPVSTCESCIHWQPLGERGHSTVGECTVTRVPPYRAFVPPDRNFTTENYRMLTTYDFGCIQWEAALSASPVTPQNK